MRELLVDLFAGGGGASTGIELATGRHVDIAINHDPAAIAMHKVNHPHTKHYLEDIYFWLTCYREARFSRGRGLGGIKKKVGLRETRRWERGSANTF